MKALIIKKSDLRHNINVIKNLNNSKDYTIIGVVKGNGYGLGLIEYAKFLIDNGIEVLAVATIEEALILRKEGIKEDIINLSSIATESEIRELVANNIIITIGSLQTAKIANKIAKEGKKIRAHIKIDTGFGRYGFLYDDIDLIKSTIKEMDNNIILEGIFSHFSLAYYKNNKWTNIQFGRFMHVLNELEADNINIKMKHICNSPAFINYPDMRLNAARIGSAFLGRVDTEESIGLKKIGEVKANIAEIKVLPKGFNVGYLNTYKTKKETKIAIVPLGYKEGYNIGLKEDMFRFVDKLRNLYHDFKKLFKKEQLVVKINEKKYNVIGKLGMYHIAIDITGSNVKMEDEVYFNINPIYVDGALRREYE